MRPEQTARVALVLAAAAVLCFVLACEYSSRPIQVYYVAGAGGGPASSLPEGEGQKPRQADELLALGGVNINTASEEELCRLPGVGPATARRIIQYREGHGGFYDIDELAQVPGIGEKTVARLAPYVTV